MNRSPPPYRGHTTVERILDHLADIYLAGKGIVQELEQWNRRPVRGRVFIDGVESMTQPDGAPIDIPDNDVPAVVQWQDRLGENKSGTTTDTTWEAQDDTGNPSAAVAITPGNDDEHVMVTFNQGHGLFKIVARTEGENGEVTAESALYNITPGAAAVGVIEVNPTTPAQSAQHEQRQSGSHGEHAQDEPVVPPPDK